MVVVEDTQVVVAGRARVLDGLRTELLAAFARVVDSERFADRPEVEALETEFAQMYGAGHAVAVNSGTAALHLALLAAGVGRESEVVVPVDAPPHVLGAVELAGARAMPADIEPAGFAIDPREVERVMTAATGAVVAVHRFGEMANLPDLERITRRTGIALVEDATEAVGAVLNGAAAGTIGDVGCIAFSGPGSVATTGDGAVVLSGSGEIAARVAGMRGGDGGFGCWMGELEAAALRLIAPHIAEWTAARQAAATLYESELSRAPVKLPGGGVYSRYVIRTRYRHALLQYLAAEGISAEAPWRLAPEWAGADGFLNARAAERDMVALPMYSSISVDEVLAVTRAVRQFGKFSAAMASEADAAAAH
jgi:dTDP-4-amino-4,6-dideoxygalactose transaminase